MTMTMVNKGFAQDILLLEYEAEFVRLCASHIHDFELLGFNVRPLIFIEYLYYMGQCISSEDNTNVKFSAIVSKEWELYQCDPNTKSITFLGSNVFFYIYDH